MSHAQKSIHHPDNFLAEIMDSFDDLIWSLALPNLTALYFNAAAVKIYQCSSDDLLDNGYLWLDLIAIDDQPKMRQAIAQAQKTGSSQITYRIQPTRGEFCCLSARLKIFKDASGLPIRLDAIAYEITEISDRQSSDLAVHHLINNCQQTHNKNIYIEGVILQSESNYRQIVEQQRDLILRSLPDTTITFANESLCQILGSSLEEVIGKRWIDFADPDDLQTILYSLSTLSPEQSSFIAVNRDRRPNNQIGWTQWINQGFFDQQGELVEIQSVGRDITALKSSELALKQLNEELEMRIEQRTADLRQSEARNLAIIHALPDLLLLLKPDGTCVECIMPSTDAKSKYLPIQDHISEVLSPENLAAQLRQCEKAIATGEVQVYEHQLTKFGKTVYEEIRIAPYCENELLVIVRDVNDRKKTEQQLQNLTDRLTLAIKSAAIGIWEWDIAHNCLVWDERTYALYGVNPDQSTDAYLAWASRVHPDDRARTETAVQLALNGEKEYEPEFRIVLPDGSIRYLKAYALVQRNDEGEPQRLIGINFDITDRKLAEAQLLKSDTHLKTAQRIGKLGSWEYQIDTGCITWSDEVFRIYGIEPSANPPTYEQLQLYIHPDDWKHFDKIVQAAMNLGQSYDLEHRIIHRNGPLIYVMARGEMIYNGSGQLTHIIGTVMDVTDRKLAEQKIIQTAHQLANTNRELESFSYSVSHDLRAPLRHINGFVNALQQRLMTHQALNDSKVTHYLQVIDSSSKKMGHLIDGLLTLSRYGRRPLESKQISIRELVDEAIEIICADPHHNPLVEFAIGDLPTTVGDPTLLQQVFRNLIGNAVKFSRNQPQPYIVIDSLPDQTIRIKDNGVGFQMEYADKLFGAFQRLHSETEFEGTGIGLAIVQRIVQRHDGLIWAEGDPDQGATFFVKLHN